MSRIFDHFLKHIILLALLFWQHLSQIKLIFLRCLVFLAWFRLKFHLLRKLALSVWGFNLPHLVFDFGKFFGQSFVLFEQFSVLVFHFLLFPDSVCDDFFVLPFGIGVLNKLVHVGDEPICGVFKVGLGDLAVLDCPTKALLAGAIVGGMRVHWGIILTSIFIIFYL